MSYEGNKEPRSARARAARAGAAAVAVAVLGVGAAVALRPGSSQHPVSALAPAESEPTIVPGAPKVDLSLMIDRSLPNLDHVKAPPGMIGVGDKEGVVRGFIPDDMWGDHEEHVRLGGGVFDGKVLVVRTLDGTVTGYALDGLGFVPKSVADDPARLRPVLDQYDAVAKFYAPYLRAQEEAMSHTDE